jgi:hypothetical protein
MEKTCKNCGKITECTSSHNDLKWCSRWTPKPFPKVPTDNQPVPVAPPIKSNNHIQKAKDWRVKKICETCGNVDGPDCKANVICCNYSAWKPKDGKPLPVDVAPKDIEKEGKPKPSLLPLDCLIELLSPAYAEGLIKYYRDSWRIGFYVSDMFDATLRHLNAFYHDGQDIDPKSPTKKLHLGGAIFSIICMYWSLKINPNKFDDRRGKPAHAVRFGKGE